MKSICHTKCLLGLGILSLWGLHIAMLPLPLRAHELRLTDPPHPLDQQLTTCMQEHPGTTSERHCMETLIPLWQQRMEKYYALLGGDKNLPLKQAQARWQQYAEAQIAYFRQKYDVQGTMYRLFFADAQLELIRHRTLQLEDDYDFLQVHH